MLNHIYDHFSSSVKDWHVRYAKVTIQNIFIYHVINKTRTMIQQYCSLLVVFYFILQ